MPKVAHAGPRISIAFRHGMDARAYHRDTGPDGVNAPSGGTDSR